MADQEYLKGSRIAFPSDLLDDTQGHWMNIQAYRTGDSTSSFDTISLFIPGGGQNTLTFDSKYDYVDTTLTKVAASMLGVGPFVAGINAMLNMSGAAINPKVEVLFRNPQLRTFDFMFMFSPASEKESMDMKSIIKTLRYHAAPEQVGGSDDPQAGYIGNASAQWDYLSTGGLWKTPSEFVIKFYRKDGGSFVENDSIPKIGRCVIEDIDVNYTPQGEYSTFSNGHPVSAMLKVVFKELRVIDKRNIESGY